MSSVTILSSSPDRTQAIAGALAQKARSGDVYCLEGGLAAGKTVFVQGFAAGLGIREALGSPSFTIIQEYTAPPPHSFTVYHIDLYRMEHVGEIYDIGLDELLASDAVCLIEWPDRAQALLPKDCIRIRIRVLENGDRELRIQGQDEREIRVN